MEKRKKISIWIVVAIIILTYLYTILPGTKRYFPCYALFRATADYNLYPSKLPQPTHDIRYYVYEFLFTDKSGFTVTLSPDEYEDMKKSEAERFNIETSFECYQYNNGTKFYPNESQMREMGIGFLEQLISESPEQYYFLGYHLCDSTSVYLYEGVLCNDKTCEIVQFTYYQNYGW